ncbi:IS110 family transposase [Azospirillum canadense]|nr:transposase [Azospirillum canadense]
MLWQGKCPTTPETIATTLRAKAAHAVRIGLETGPLTPWLWHGLHERGLPVLCLDARHAKAALSMQLNKTDRNYALGLAQVVRTGWYKQVDVKSLPSHETRALVGARAQLVGMRTETSNLIRGTLKTFGLVLDKGCGSVFEANVRELAGDQPALWPLIEGLLSVWQMLGEQIGAIEQRLLEQARGSAVCRRLMTIPGGRTDGGDLHHDH